MFVCVCIRARVFRAHCGRICLLYKHLKCVRATKRVRKRDDDGAEGEQERETERP